MDDGLEHNPHVSRSAAQHIPTTSVDACYAELALWFGIAPADLERVLPNIRRFYSPESMTPPVGFMS